MKNIIIKLLLLLPFIFITSCGESVDKSQLDETIWVYTNENLNINSVSSDFIKKDFTTDNTVSGKYKVIFFPKIVELKSICLDIVNGKFSINYRLIQIPQETNSQNQIGSLVLKNFDKNIEIHIAVKYIP